MYCGQMPLDELSVCSSLAEEAIVYYYEELAMQEMQSFVGFHIYSHIMVRSIFTFDQVW